MKNLELTDENMKKYEKLVNIFAFQLLPKCHYNLEFDDLKIMGYIGLMDAIEKYNDNMNTSFETYASIRIKGTMIDEIRKETLVSRTFNTKYKQLAEIKEKYEQINKKQIPKSEILKNLNINEKQLIDLLNCHAMQKPSSMEFLLEEKDDVLLAGTDTSLDNLMILEELKSKLNEGLEILTEKEKNVIISLYYNQLTPKEIGIQLGVTESRVSQLKFAALEKLRENEKVKVLREYL